TFKKLFKDSLKIASYLKTHIGENQNVVLISSNSVFFITAYLGILKSGNICVPLNFTIEQNNLDFILKTTECNVLFVAKSLYATHHISPEKNVIDENGMAEIINSQDITVF